jgi:hypothetical protein
MSAAMLTRATAMAASEPVGVMSAEAPSDEDRAPQRLILGAVAAVIVVESLYVFWTVSRGFFFQDDYLDLGLARQQGFTGRMIEQPVFGHFIPGYNAVNYLLASRGPYDWNAVEVVDVLLFALSLFLLHCVLVRLFGPTWTGVVLVALAGASFSLVPSIVWWASGLQQLVAIPAILLTILCHIRYLSTGRIRHAVYGGLALTVGLAFYDGALLGALFILLMTLFFWKPRTGGGGPARTFWLSRSAWIAYGIPVALDLGWRFTHHDLYATPPLPHAIEAIQFISLSWTQTFIPLLFGVNVWLLAGHLERLLVGALGQMVLIAFVVWSIHRRPTAWRAWVVFGLTFLTSTVLVGLTRVSIFGAGDASDVRYVTICVYLFVLSLGFVLLPFRLRESGAAGLELMSMRERAQRGKHGAAKEQRIVHPALVIPVVIVVLVAYSALLGFDQSRDFVIQDDIATRSYFSTFAASWPPKDSVHPFLWDTEVSPVSVSASFYPYDTASFTVGKLHPTVPIDAWGGSGYLLTANGSVIRAVATTIATGDVIPSSGCVVAGNGPASITVNLDHVTGAQTTFGLLSYRSNTGALATDSLGDLVHFPKGSGKLLVRLPPVSIDSVGLFVPAHRHLCVSALRIVIPEPAAGN